jgi:hypothetical protein
MEIGRTFEQMTIMAMTCSGIGVSPNGIATPNLSGQTINEPHIVM